MSKHPVRVCFFVEQAFGIGQGKEPTKEEGNKKDA
jgi:hypothetical protein